MGRYLPIAATDWKYCWRPEGQTIASFRPGPPTAATDPGGGLHRARLVRGTVWGDESTCRNDASSASAATSAEAKRRDRRRGARLSLSTHQSPSRGRGSRDRRKAAIARAKMTNQLDATMPTIATTTAGSWAATHRESDPKSHSKVCPAK